MAAAASTATPSLSPALNWGSEMAAVAEVSEVGEGQDVGRRRLEPGAMAAFRDCRQGDVRGECFFHRFMLCCLHGYIGEQIGGL